MAGVGGVGGGGNDGGGNDWNQEEECDVLTKKRCK
jgi:hypothetical protein